MPRAATARPSATQAGERNDLLWIDGLSVDFATDHGWANVISDVSFGVGQGEVVGLVGESGSGKTVTGLSILGLVPSPPGRLTGGHIWFDGRDLTAMSERQLRDIRGNDIAMIFQEPMTSLNPAFTVGDQISETFRRHRGGSRRAGRKRAIEVLELVGIPNAGRRVHSYPHEFSGGMRQRAMIAMALTCEPKILLADEPTTALDVTIQAQILDLLSSMRDSIGMGVLLITHDLGVVAETCDRVVVMYAGQVVERSPIEPIFERPRMPYTEGLLSAMPQVGAASGRLASIPGRTPEPWNMPTGCRFHPRCPYTLPKCTEGPIRLLPVGPERDSRCVRTDELRLTGVK
jgi:peptide/nickel transport system ATP-binding protein